MNFKTKIDFVHAMRFTDQTKDDVWNFVAHTEDVSKCAGWNRGDAVMLIQCRGLPEQRVCLGDWVVKMKDGKYRVFTQVDFDAVYELVEEEQPDAAMEQANVEEFKALGIEGTEVLFRTCCKVCRNTGDCGPDCPDFPAAEIIELMERRIVELQGATNAVQTQFPPFRKEVTPGPLCRNLPDK